MITIASSRKEAEIAPFTALGQYLGKTDPTAVKGAISDLQERVASLERKLAGRLVS